MAVIGTKISPRTHTNNDAVLEASCTPHGDPIKDKSKSEVKSSRTTLTMSKAANHWFCCEYM
jgi:hypothetical protein